MGGLVMTIGNLTSSQQITAVKEGLSLKTSALSLPTIWALTSNGLRMKRTSLMI